MTPPTDDTPPDLGAEEGILLAPGVRAPRSALRFGVARSGGPGGQNVNKLNTKVEVWLMPALLRGLDPAALARLRALAGSRLTAAGEIHVSSQASRSQEANREDALRKLSELVARALHVPKPRRKTKPSRASKARRLETKRRRSKVKSLRRGGASE